ncbi:MAG: bifunctional phosphoribosylaminoimidazolecarboxamide formyltransferase/IMP cyclohydrolase [candidate division WOR-3 bacterium]|nr:bifunctional phosphoribosylaminoimidazolecarboxamide formyltransferase/IMP cyclohydrolase [candidate division WOR-3 bacterium]
MKIQRAIISVYDKEGIIEFAKILAQNRIEIIATAKTADLLRNNNIPVIEVSQFTGAEEILDGRVKTLHPKIAGGILSYRRNEDILPIDLVICNLYPFEDALKKDLALSEMVELIDIGGVTLLRAGAKNFEFVTVVPDKKFYPMIIAELQNNGEVSLATRQLLMMKTWEIIAHYDAVIKQYFLNYFQSIDFEEYYTKTYRKSLPLRYGENPHQKAFFYQDPFSNFSITQLQGKELSYNNLLDLDAVISIVSDFAENTCAIVKHNTPCGVATNHNPTRAYLKALASDTKSAFGGIVAFNCPVDGATAKEMVKIFLEVVAAPDFSNEALSILRTKKNLRVIQFQGELSQKQFRSCLGGILIQQQDDLKENIDNWKVVSKRTPTQDELNELAFAWRVVKFVKSNAIVITKDKATVGIGGGQTSRVDAVEIALKKAQINLAGAVMASDGFFPFRDSIDLAAKNGIKVIIEPGGSINDNEVIQAANENGVCLVFTGTRHFRH